MDLTDDALGAMWAKLTNATGNWAPRDIPRAVASLGGSDADAIYCTSYTNPAGNRVWWVLAVKGRLLIHVRATGPEFWEMDEDKPADSLEAFAAPVKDFVRALRVSNTMSTTPHRAREQQPVSPWTVRWTVTTPEETWPLPHPKDQSRDQWERTEEVALAILSQLAS